MHQDFIFILILYIHILIIITSLVIHDMIKVLFDTETQLCSCSNSHAAVFFGDDQ